MAFKDLNLDNRLVAVHTDMLRHPDFCILGGVTQVGKVVVIEGLPTAGTDGADVYYGRAFNEMQNRKQLRYIVAHESGHKMLRHCTDYNHLRKKYPRDFAMAVDYVVNINIELLDTKFGSKEAFLERPAGATPLVSQKYADMSVPEVLRDLLQNGMPKDQPQPKAGEGGVGDPLDDHMSPKGSGEDGQPTQEEQAAFEKVKQQIEDAVLQGEIVQSQLRGNSGSPNRTLSGFREQYTDWRGPLKCWFEEIVEGDDQSRFSPPNKRMLPQGIIMPSHFSEATGEIIVACDTSGSMGGVYPIVFGELCRICQNARPAKLRVLWWDTKVASEQVFYPKDYDKVKDLMKPQGGGGTTVSCVAQYVRDKGYRPKGTIYLSDGYIESQYETVPGNVLWGIIGNAAFRPLRGKALYIEET